MDGTSLYRILGKIRAHELELRNLGVCHVAVFGSVARGEERRESDVDVLIDLDEARPIGIFEYSRVKLFLNEILEVNVDTVNRRTLKPLLRESILRDVVSAF